MVKKILVAVGVLVLVAGASAGGWYYMTKRNFEAMGKTSQAFADTSIRAVIADWDGRELDKRASPELKKAAGRGGLDKLVTLFKTRLGGLKQYHGLDDESEVMHHVDTGMDEANYSATADFERGSAVIRVQLVGRDNAWQLAAFRVRSAALLDAPATAGQAKAAAPEPDPKAPTSVAAPQPDPAEAVKPTVEPKAVPASVPVAPAAPATTPPAAVRARAEEPAPAARGMPAANVDLRKCMSLQSNAEIARCASAR